MKTIFIIITRGFIIRNVLRSGGLQFLRNKGFRIVVIFGFNDIPEYLKKELEDNNTTLLLGPKIFHSRFHKFIDNITSFLLFTDSTNRYLRYGNPYLVQRARYKTYIQIAFVFLISKIRFLKPIMRWIELNRFPEENKTIKEHFDQYRPDLVFSTSIISGLDIAYMKEAKRRGVKTVAMPKGWDNITRNYFKFLPDHILVQTEILKKKIIELQDYPGEKVKVIGFPQFDWYKKPEIIRPRQEHLEHLGLDPDLPYILFGSEGRWADRDYEIANKIYDWIKNNELVVPCQLLIRPHFSNIKNIGDFLKVFENKEKVNIDRDINIIDNAIDNWDPIDSDTINLTNTIYHSRMIVTTASTLNLDAACLDKPAINLGFGGKYRFEEDITPWLYYSDHMKWVLETGAISLAENENELKKMINEHLVGDPTRSKRQSLRDKLCYKVDGKSSERMVNALVDILKEQ